jgi:two-component system, sensor histidine kinase
LLREPELLHMKASSKRKKILIVEDEQIVAEDLQRTLERLGYTVTAQSASAREAINQAGNTLPDLVLMDINLKGDTDGVQAAEVIYWLYNIPVIYLTAFSQDLRFQEITKSNRFGYLPKPYLEEDLQDAIENALKKAETRQATRLY